MKGYKGFDSELKCRDFQYEVGKTYETDKADLCESGFHFCEAPLDVFTYYPPAGNGKMSRYCEVEADDVSNQKSDDSKRVSKKLTVGAEIGIPGLVKAHIEYVKENVKEAVKCQVPAGIRGNLKSLFIQKYNSLFCDIQSFSFQIA